LKTVLKFLLGFLAFGALPGIAHAQSFACAVSNGAPYCSYTGKLSRVYINESNTMLFYFEQTADIALPASVDYTGVTNGMAAAYTATVNPIFAEFFYSTALTALAADKTVGIQMRQTVGRYLKVDRIWLYK